MIVAPQVVATIAVSFTVVTFFLAVVIVALAFVLVIALQVVAAVAVAIAVVTFFLAIIVAIISALIVFVANQIVATIVVVVALVALLLAIFNADLRHSGSDATVRQQSTSQAGGQQLEHIASGRPVEQSCPPVKLSSFHCRSSTAYLERVSKPQ